MTSPRRSLIDTVSTRYYHCVARCVRRAWLCGQDHRTGSNYEHRSQWVTDCLLLLVNIFAIEICAYVIMSNHYHLVLHINATEAKQRSDRAANKEDGCKGCFWESRFKSQALLGGRGLLTCWLMWTLILSGQKCRQHLKPLSKHPVANNRSRAKLTDEKSGAAVQLNPLQCTGQNPMLPFR